MSADPRTPLKVLLVDDSPLMGVLMSAWLEHSGIELTYVQDHFEDLLSVSNTVWNGVDVILCDLGLNGFNGLQILEHAREFHPTVRRVCFTGAYGQHVAEAASISDALLSKPAGMDDIMRAILG